MQYLEYLLTVTYNMKNQSLIRRRDVYDVLVQISEGKVTTYGDIGRAPGHPAHPAELEGFEQEPKRNSDSMLHCHHVRRQRRRVCLWKAGKKELLKKEGLCFIRDNTADSKMQDYA
jgi:alkylated DNA nucleotide flippase Atl1